MWVKPQLCWQRFSTGQSLLTIRSITRTKTVYLMWAVELKDPFGSLTNYRNNLETYKLIIITIINLSSRSSAIRHALDNDEAYPLHSIPSMFLPSLNVEVDHESCSRPFTQITLQPCVSSNGLLESFSGPAQHVPVSFSLYFELVISHPSSPTRRSNSLAKDRLRCFKFLWRRHNTVTERIIT